MKRHSSLHPTAMVCGLAAWASLISSTCSAQSLIAADYSINSTYATDWSDGQNGGFGFTPWSFAGTSGSAVQQGIDTTSPFNHLGPAWRIYNPEGRPLGTDLAEAGRGFPALQVGQTLSTIFENPTNRIFFRGYTIRLVTGAENTTAPGSTSLERLAIYMFDYYPFDTNVGAWKTTGGFSTLFDTNTAHAGARLDVTLTGADNYQFTLAPLDNPANAYTETGTLKNSGPVNWIQFEFYNAASDPTNEATDFYVSSITIGGVQPLPPKFVVQPASRVIYPGRTARFHGSVTGTPLSYQWRKDNANLSNGGNISGAFTDTLLISNAGMKDVGSYKLIATNTSGLGAVTSAPPVALTLAQPSGTPYENAVLAANPVAHWRLNETSNPATNPPAYDYAGGLAGTYGSAALNGFNSIRGPPRSDWPGFGANNYALEPTTNTDQSWVTVPALNLNTNTATFTLWVNPNDSFQLATPGLFVTREGSTSAAGVGFYDSFQLGYNWNNDPATYQFASGLVPPPNQWSFVALVIEPTQATLYLFNTNNLSSAVNSVSHANAAWDGNARIGDDENNAAWIFDGIIDEVAVFNYSFTSNQVFNLYNAASGVALNIQKSGANVVLDWPRGTLLEATNLSGPWTTNNAASPYSVIPTAAKKFYRVSVQ